MGVDAGDFDGNGTEDIFVTHLMEETNTLYANLGSGFFEDRTREAGLALQSARFTGFGTLWFRYGGSEQCRPQGEAGISTPSLQDQSKTLRIPESR